MSHDNNIVLNRIFTKNVIKDLIQGKSNKIYSTCINRYLTDIHQRYNKDIFYELYKYISHKQRNEYLYKNTLLNKLLLGRHSLNTTTALTEIPVNKSKADFVLINGKAVVYEIKTGLDNFERLESQINDYYKVFNHVCVLTCKENFNKLYEVLKNTNVGICVLTNNNRISTKTKPVEDNSKLDYIAIFKILRKKEFENIILNYYGELPQTSQVTYYSRCLDLFKNIDILQAQAFMCNELKKRKLKEVNEFNNVPIELKFLVYFSNFKKSDYSSLNNFLEQEYRG